MFIVNHEVLLFDPIGVVPCVYTIYYKHVIPSGLGFCHANHTPHSSSHTTIIFYGLCATFAPFAVNYAAIVEQILRYTQNDKGLTITTTHSTPHTPRIQYLSIEQILHFVQNDKFHPNEILMHFMGQVGQAHKKLGGALAPQ